MSDTSPPPVRYFYGLQPRWLRWDRLYRVYAGGGMLAGAYVAGQVYDGPSAAAQLQQVGPLVRPLVRRRFARRRQREALYDSVSPFGPELLAHDPRNFQLPRADVARTRFRRNRSLWTPFNVGSVEFHLGDGRRWRFILVGDQDPDAVLDLVRGFDPAVEVTGTANPRRRPRPLSPAGRRRLHAVLAVWLLGAAALFGWAAWAGVGANPLHLPLAVANAVLGVWSLVTACRPPRGRAAPAAEPDRGESSP